VGESADTALILWQFPEQPGPLVSVVECAVVNLDAKLLTHKCDSSVGTSGAPVQARSGGEVVALHVAGCTQTSGTASCVNFGVPFGRIRERVREVEGLIRQKLPNEAAQILAAFGLGTP
jgi:hypothetical protein